MDAKEIGFCEKHTRLLEENGVSADNLIDHLIPAIAGLLTKTPFFHAEDRREAAAHVLKYYGRGQPFCCRLGDDRLGEILTKTATQIEIKKAQRQ